MRSELFSESLSLERMMQDRTEAPLVWSKPDHFNLSDSVDHRELQRRMAAGGIDKVIDRVDYIADDMFEMRHPDQKDDASARAEYIADIKGQGPGYGTWVNYGWKGAVVRFPDQQDYYDLITFRNRPLISEAEQSKLSRSTIATMGLSVGSSINDQLVQSGVGDTFVMGDYDILTPSNLNRIRSSLAHVGMRKLDIQACKVSEFNPYIKQVHLHEGVTKSSLHELSAAKPDIIFDAVDDLSVKAMLRVFAREHEIPLVMATDLGDVSVIDIERYDTGGVEPFNNRVSSKDMDLLTSGVLSKDDRRRLLLKIVGVRRLTTRLLDASMQIDKKTIGGLPQLGATAAMGGSLATFATREILLGRKMETGRYVSSPKSTLHMQSPSTLRESVTVASSFAAAMLFDSNKK